MLSVAEPPLTRLPASPPTPSLLPIVHVEPAPLTRTVPVDPVSAARRASKLTTLPPSRIFTAAVPPNATVSSAPARFQLEPCPTTFTSACHVLSAARVPLVVHIEPGPSTVAVPCEPATLPTKPVVQVTAPPASTLSEPLPPLS